MELIAQEIAGVILFVSILYIAHRGDALVAGMMLTFPVLNGLALLASNENASSAASAMLPMIALNGVLCLGVMQASRMGKQEGNNDVSWVISLIAAGIWIFASTLQMRLEENMQVPFMLMFLVAGTALTLYLLFKPIQTSRSAASTEKPPFLRTNVLLVFVFAISLLVILLFSSIFQESADWLGRLGALPLVPLFALAILAHRDPDELVKMKTTVLSGPVIAMAFVYTVSSPLGKMFGLHSWYAVPLITIIVGWLLALLLIFSIARAIRVIIFRKQLTSS